MNIESIQLQLSPNEEEKCFDFSENDYIKNTESQSCNNLSLELLALFINNSLHAIVNFEFYKLKFNIKIINGEEVTIELLKINNNLTIIQKRKEEITKEFFLIDDLISELKNKKETTSFNKSKIINFYQTNNNDKCIFKKDKDNNLFLIIYNPKYFNNYDTILNDLIIKQLTFLRNEFIEIIAHKNKQKSSLLRKFLLQLVDTDDLHKNLDTIKNTSIKTAQEMRIKIIDCYIEFGAESLIKNVNYYFDQLEASILSSEKITRPDPNSSKEEKLNYLRNYTKKYRNLDNLIFLSQFFGFYKKEIETENSKFNKPLKKTNRILSNFFDITLSNNNGSIYANNNDENEMNLLSLDETLKIVISVLLKLFKDESVKKHIPFTIIMDNKYYEESLDWEKRKELSKQNIKLHFSEKK